MNTPARGPGSNQHQDKPPVAPRDATGAPRVGAVAVADDPLASTSSPLRGMDPVLVDGEVTEYRTDWQDETEYSPNGDPQNAVPIPYTVEVVARPCEDEDDPDSGRAIFDVEVSLHGGQEACEQDVFETDHEVGTPTFDAQWAEFRDDLVSQAERNAEFPEPDFDEPDSGWERY